MGISTGELPSHSKVMNFGTEELPSRSQVVDVLSQDSVFRESQEACRTWRRRCVQAEAELRSLQKQMGITAANVAASTASSAAQSNDGEDVGSEADGHEDVTLVDELEAQKALGRLQGLERHMSELGTWRQSVEQELADARSKADSLTERLDGERARVRQLSGETAVVSKRAKDLTDHLEQKVCEYESMNNAIQYQARVCLAENASKPELLRELTQATAEAVKLQPLTEELAAGVSEAREKRERLRMNREEARQRRLVNIEIHETSVRNIAIAKQQLQAHGAQLGRLQGEAMRTRTKGDRSRRQLENEVVQCRGEVADAEARAEAANEQLRKLRQRQGLEIKKLRSGMGGLQEEVDERLRAIESEETELSALQRQEESIEADQRHFAANEANMEQEAIALRDSAEHLQRTVAGSEASLRALRERLSLAESSQERMSGQLAVFQEQSGMSRVLVAEAESMSAQLRVEVNEERNRSTSQSEQVGRFRDLEATMQAARERNNRLAEDRQQLEEASQQSQRAYDRHLADMQEIARRIGRLKVSHGELLGVMPVNSKGREAMIGAIDRSMGRINQRMEAVVSFLEHKESGQRKPANPDLLATSQRSQAALHKQLLTEAEQSISVFIADERRRVVEEQQSYLGHIRSHAKEVGRLRVERRTVEDQLAQRRRDLEHARCQSRTELSALADLVRFVDREVLVSEEAVAAEFSDLSQKQALERDFLQRQVDALSHEADVASRADWLASDEEPEEEFQESPSQPDMGTRLRNAVTVAKALRSHEELLQQRHVKLKAAVVASKILPPWKPTIQHVTSGEIVALATTGRSRSNDTSRRSSVDVANRDSARPAGLRSLSAARLASKEERINAQHIAVQESRVAPDPVSRSTSALHHRDSALDCDANIDRGDRCGGASGFASSKLAVPSRQQVASGSASVAEAPLEAPAAMLAEPTEILEGEPEEQPEPGNDTPVQRPSKPDTWPFPASLHRSEVTPARRNFHAMISPTSSTPNVRGASAALLLGSMRSASAHSNSTSCSTPMLQRLAAGADNRTPPQASQHMITGIDSEGSTPNHVNRQDAVSPGRQACRRDSSRLLGTSNSTPTLPGAAPAPSLQPARSVVEPGGQVATWPTASMGKPVTVIEGGVQTFPVDS